MAGFEPAISCSRSRRSNQAFLHPVRSAQRESNPHFRLGKAIGCRYIMGTDFRSRFVKEIKSTGWDSNPQADIAATRFQDGPLIRPVGFRRSIFVTSTISSSGGWNRTSGLHVQSVALLPAVTAPESLIREEGFEPPPPDSKSGSLPVSRFPRAPRGSRTRLSGLGSPCLAARPRTLGQFMSFASEHRREESNLQSSP